MMEFTKEQLKNEEWRTVVYDGEVFEDYEVSNTGKVRSLDRVDASGHKRKGKILKPQKINSGYLVVGLWKNGKASKLLIHRIVAFTWILNDDPINKTEVNHISEVKTDCSVENLEWCDRKYNLYYGTGRERQTKTIKKTVRKTKGKKVIGKSLTENKVIILNSISQANNFGFDASAIFKCCNGKFSQHHGYKWSYVAN